jgi:hypothetical protein
VVQGALLAAVLLFHGMALENYYFDSRYAREDARGAARYLESVVRPGDRIVSVGNPIVVGYYTQGRLSITPVKPRKMPRPLDGPARALAADYNRLWLLEIRPWQRDPKGEMKATLDRLFPLVERRHFPGVNVYCYNLTP